jgi:hypothetical protein
MIKDIFDQPINENQTLCLVSHITGGLTTVVTKRMLEICSKDYIRISDFIEVHFPLLPEEVIIQKKLKILDDKIEEIKQNSYVKLEELKEQKQKLLALTYISSNGQ